MASGNADFACKSVNQQVLTVGQLTTVEPECVANERRAVSCWMRLSPLRAPTAACSTRLRPLSAVDALAYGGNSNMPENIRIIIFF